MKSLDQLPKTKLIALFTDIDGTLTDSEGRIDSGVYSALWDLSLSGVKIIPVTGRPAGWCEMIARTWPVHGVIGENGAFYFRKTKNGMVRHYLESPESMKINKEKLEKIKTEVLANVQGTAVASDQFCRIFDLAIDFAEDVKPLGKDAVEKIMAHFKKYEATAKVSNIHVNGWFGNYDKLSACKEYCRKELGDDFHNLTKAIAFVGDSPNDEPMFHGFPLSFAVSNIKHFESQLTHLPKFVASLPEGKGFQEIAKALRS